jgi:hypothetical protein
MSKLYDLREALAASIIAADIGFTSENVILKRQTDLWNDVASSIDASKDGVVLHIGIAEGAGTEDEELEIDTTIPLTILALPQVDENARPEEDLWEDLVRHVHDLRLGTDHHALRFIFKSFTDLEIEADRGTGYLGRQTVFSKRLSL